ncbi:MAG: alpha-amylase/4-alpha-glucanotransferase domain-containing protein, partial [Candidatus Omnitrophota bacterium]
ESRIAGINDTGAVSGSSLFSIKDSGGDMSVDFIFSKKAESIWYFPVKTISQSERAYELNFQASCIVPRWQIKLESARELKFNIRLSY